MSYRFSTTIEISAPPAVVWEVMRDVVAWREWTSSVTSIELLDGEAIAVGGRARVRQPRFPTAVWRLTDIQPGREFTWVSGNPLVRVVATHAVAARADGAAATLSITYSGPLAWLVVRLTRDINDRYLALEAAGLKSRSEQRATGR